MTETLNLRKSLNHNTWRNFHIMLEYTDLGKENGIQLEYNLQLSNDRLISPNDLTNPRN